MPRAASDDKPIHVFVPESWHDWLRDEAHARRLPISELVRRALQATYPDLPPRPAPDPPEVGRKGGEYQVNPAYGRSICADHG